MALKNSAAWASSGNIPALLAARQTDAFRPLPGRDAFVASLPHVVFPRKVVVQAATGRYPPDPPCAP